MYSFLKWAQTVLTRRSFLGVAAFGFFHFIFRKAAWAAPPFIREKEFQIRSIEKNQSIDLKGWRLKIEGLVDQPVTLDFDQIQALPRKTQIKNFICVEGWGLENQKWEGVLLKDIFTSSKVKIDPKAKYITFHATGGKYQDSLSLQEALEPETMLAFKLNDKPLPPDNGFPLRLVIPRMYGYKGVKWVERMVLTEEAEPGFWERFGYPMDASLREFED